MSYEIYKFIHIATIFLFIAFIVANFLMERPSKIVKILNGVLPLLIFAGGMGLMARTGIAKGQWPGWIHAKIAIWLLLTIAVPVTAKRFKEKANVLLPLFMVLLIAAAGVVIYTKYS